MTHPQVTVKKGDFDTLFCTADGCQSQIIATCYCVKCEDMFCTQHQQVYSYYLKSKIAHVQYYN